MTLHLTRIVPNPRSNDARRDARSAVDTHRRLMSLFPQHTGPDPRARFGVLYRTDDTPTGPHLLVQSTHQPDLTRLPDAYGTALTRPLDPLLNALRPGLTIRFRCVASPVRKPGATTRALYNLPAVVALSGTAADEWWLRQADTAGLKVLSLHSTPLDAARGTRAPRDSTSKQHINHKRTQFDGAATIIDPDQLRTTLTTGIGRGKAYGCGLLTIAPTRTAHP
ncbi:type I-E CRISPR-associated protein Cas6/Cse3/CasE [Streptomyces somaliensis]|uniref:type I-E CRISPR-associated protein Cas6/Cse3/CasE n=1 Tax=Streptomyces somaliensis TaxID=78355 RepID=UPI0020CBD060|nr:type I-E CRISPR-associated protein Cas6/Cse3/CasE [Streptomyces somaliensis]MCP9946021.1 type I-E CRISPR-associated protein Cas6/Cse3/CasE [Streptomyces somaliensis]MCP9960812.1 type I-E CRISPR-associated protein Cas6/Cse3/CasE [Streptomyces somaliensis]MCP9973598.1 type I-E CRISPR-associated protein Cas6/Cse3/CasE [Streptomyces somaliensis]